MIEVFDRRENLLGIVEGNKYYDKNQDLLGYIEIREFKLPNGYTILLLDEENFIKDEDGDVGYLDDDYFRFPEYWLLSVMFTSQNIDRGFSKEKGELYNYKGKIIGYVRGDINDLTNLDYFGILIAFYDLGA